MSNNEINYKFLCVYKFAGNLEARNELKIHESVNN